MNKKLLGIIAAVLVVGVGAWLLFGSNSSNNDGSAKQANRTDDSQVDGSLLSIADSGRARECTFSVNSASGNSTATFVTDGKGRGLMTMKSTGNNDASITTNTLVAADKVYGWTETGGRAIGFVYDKAQLTASSAPASEGSNSDSGSGAKANYKMQCKAWTIDESKLQVPTNVSFTSLRTTN
jgi:hypothetical protein